MYRGTDVSSVIENNDNIKRRIIVLRIYLNLYLDDRKRQMIKIFQIDYKKFLYTFMIKTDEIKKVGFFFFVTLTYDGIVVLHHARLCFFQYTEIRSFFDNNFFANSFWIQNV